MTNKHERTLLAIFEEPVRANVNWKDIEALFHYYGATISEREGSRVAVYLNGRIAIFHRPHPEKETDKGALRSVRKFLVNAGVLPAEE
jgi:hypothetical protein